MKFRRQERYSYHWTPAKEADYLRKPQRVQNKLASGIRLLPTSLQRRRVRLRKKNNAGKN
ncbi:hypothetical protein EX404_23690 [Salmonella enterica]|uniref:hypothetical protein n=1 Tax=Salmonella enterica TaxID=28901 RepID=UPI00127707B3|nr:hypothetical protein [Salmonella enterica]ECE0793244.1 hypothetical protein [Salmonella enterica subsp. diarizonae]ECQ8979535.1 hypothetical protein [Salmonella enterica subsp. enterica]EDU6369156.1 hypothetical protein [Salmonella enterica subsp. houtenae serovar 40:z4,z24:-]MCH5493725.1 hypothetical protein [Salmonella enterica subsp. diarizonae serovar 16:z10:e,n,x,z15]